MSEQAILQIDTDEELKKIMRQLKSLPDQIAAPNILKNALNSTARQVRKQFIKDVKGQYALSDTSVLRQEKKGGLKVLGASVSTLYATIRSRGPMQDIMTYMTRPNKDTAAAAAKVLNSSAMKSLELGNIKAFFTQFKSGHIAIVQRKGPERLPVKKLLSPAVPHLLNNEEVRATATAMTYDLLQAEISKHIAKVLGNAA